MSMMCHDCRRPVEDCICFEISRQSILRGTNPTPAPDNASAQPQPPAGETDNATHGDSNEGDFYTKLRLARAETVPASYYVNAIREVTNLQSQLAANQNEVLRLSGLLRVSNTGRNDARKLLSDKELEVEGLAQRAAEMQAERTKLFMENETLAAQLEKARADVEYWKSGADMWRYIANDSDL